MAEEFKPKAPDYSGDGIAIWKAIAKNGKPYLRVKKPEWANSVNCFKVEPKPETPKPVKVEDFGFDFGI